MKSKFTFKFLLLSFFALTSIGVFAQSAANNAALGFDGTGSPVNTGADIIDPTVSFTLEAWVYVNAFQPNPISFVSEGQGYANSTFLSVGLGYDGSNGGVISAGDWWESSIVMPISQWVHLALTNDVDNGITYLYVNGALKDSLPGGLIFHDGLNNFQLGDYPDDPNGANAMNGRLDEVRVWNYVRTADQIKKGMYGYTDPSTAGLVAYYDMADTTTTTVHNVSTNTSNIDGTRSGTTAWAYSPVQAGNNALNFDGVDDLVNIPASTAYDLSGPSTIELWVRPVGLTQAATVLANQDTTSGALRYRIFMTQTYIGLMNDQDSATIAYNFTPGNWYQVAFASNGTTTTIYVNGVAVNSVSNPISVNFSGSGAVSGQPLTLGLTRKNGASSNIFQGSMDELHIWNIQRAATDILSNVATTLVGNEPGLVGQFSFNQGTDDHDNRGLVTTLDNTISTNNATLQNFALTEGSPSNFSQNILSVPTPVNFSLFTAVKSGSTAVLNWQTAQEENSRDFTIERSLDGINFAPIGTIPAAGNSFLRQNYQFIDEMPLDGTDYYRIKESDLDGKGMYTVVKVLYFGSANQLTWYATGSSSATVNLKNGNSEIFTLSDVSGKTIRQGQLSAGKTDLSNLAAGMYVVKVMLATGDELTTQVVIH